MIDSTDKKILNLLQKDCKTSIKEIASKLSLTTTPIYERIKKMERDHIISKYVAIINKKSAGKNITAFCNVSLKEHSKEFIHQFEKQIIDITEIIECYHVAGIYDYMLKVVVNDMDAYHYFIYNKLSAIENIGNVRSSFVMNELKESTLIQFD